MEENQTVMEGIDVTDDTTPEAFGEEEIGAMTDEEFEAHLEGNDQEKQDTTEYVTSDESEDKGQVVIKPPIQVFETQQQWQREHEQSGKDNEYQVLENVAKKYYGMEAGDDAVRMLLSDVARQIQRQEGNPWDEQVQLARAQQEAQQLIEEQVQARMMQIRTQEYQQEQERRIETRRQLEEHADNRIRDIRSGWLREAERVAENIPGFDLKSTIQNDTTFCRRLVNGMQVDEAYYLSQRDEAMRNACAKPERKPIRENGKRHVASGIVRSDPAHLPDDEFEKYIQTLC